MSLEDASAFKDQGNAFLSQFRYSLAVEQYSKAIAIAPTAIFLSNRAQAYIKLESYGLAILDANEAVSLDPMYVKAYYRRGSANFALGKLKEARKDFKAVVKLVPSDADAAKKLKACEKAIKEEAFLKAIESDDKVVFDESTLTEMEVDASYDGPHLPSWNTADGPLSLVTMDFVHAMIDRFRAQKTIHRKYMMMLLVAAKQLFSTTPSLLRLTLPTDEVSNDMGQFTVCGDTHGQFYDLLHIFKIGGFPSASNPYLFNGDFVDRGSFSVEVVTTLLALKLASPEGLHMLRGNHETRNMNKIYGFEGEVKAKYDDKVMTLFTSVFNWLPLAAVLHNHTFITHGGLSTMEGGVTLAQIEAIPRNREPPESGLMADLLWSDPQPEIGKSPSKRGVGFAFGPDYTNAFLAQNGLKLLVRSHEVMETGYNVDHDGKCITVFSAPNYCDQMGNMGAFIRFKEDMVPNFTRFESVPHPNIPPMKYAGMMGNFGL